MTLSDVQIRAKEALKLLNKKDYLLMINNLNERAIAHQLAVKLAKRFGRFHVDCEYNGNVNADSKRKEIWLLNDKLRQLKSRQHKPRLPVNELINLSVTPDIIIHKRAKNISNLLIIEVKKSTNESRQALDFDKQKMQAYTLNENSLGNRNTFHYKFGLLLILGCSDQHYTDELTWYENGEIVEHEHLPKIINP